MEKSVTERLSQTNNESYQKIYEYKRTHWQKYSVGILAWYLPIELFLSSFLLVFIDEKFLSVNTEGILIGIKGFKKKTKKHDEV